MHKQCLSNEIKIIIGFSAMLIVLLLCSCNSHVYEGKVKNIEYSFQYWKTDKINPINPLVKTYSENVEDDSHLNITETKTDSSNDNPISVIEKFVSSYSNNSYIHDFHTQHTTLDRIAGIDVKAIKYFYNGYTTVSKPFEGLFLVFYYKDFVFQVDFLYPAEKGQLNKTVDLFKDSFTIKEVIAPK
jgi:hypothetical protein